MRIIGRVFTRIGGAIAILQSAAGASEALANGRRPSARDTKVLGINPSAFAGIGHG